MKRQLIYCPMINSASYLLLYEKGSSGDSWSIRDYSIAHTVSVRYPGDFSYDLATIRRETAQTIDAPVRSTNDLQFWYELTKEANSKLAPVVEGIQKSSDNHQSGSAASKDKQLLYEVLDEQVLLSLPKASKAHDMRRIRESPRSEDWVTWNAFRLMQHLQPVSWWSHLVALAKKSNLDIQLPAGWHEVPSVDLWQPIAAPAPYEQALRQVMRTSNNPAIVARSYGQSPVEGDSEIDIILRNAAITVFIEAKLKADISTRTTHDPYRNQIIRNIDCLLSQAGETQPAFWMMVRTVDESCTFKQLIDAYQSDPTILARALPHQDAERLAQIASGVSIITWRDFLSLVGFAGDENAKLDRVHRELLVRV